MNKQGLLEEAKRRYPIGTEVICSDNSKYKITKELDWYYDEGISHPCIGFVYRNGKWAEIVSNPVKENTPKSPHAKEYIYKDSIKQPLKLEDLKEGVVLVNKDYEITVNAVLNDIVFCLTTLKQSNHYSIYELIESGYTIKQPDPVEEYIPKVGDWVTCIKVDLTNQEVESCGAGWKNDLTFKVTKIEKWHETVSVAFGGFEGSGVYSHSIRKALPHEIPQEPKHYLGFPIGDYTGKNIIVGVSDKSFDDCLDGTAFVLKEVIKDCFIIKDGDEFITWKYAVLLPCNNHDFKLV